MLTRLEQKMMPGPMIAFMQAAVVPYVQQRIAGRFAAEGDDVTGKWHPLSMETEAIRIKHGYPGPHPINVRTSQMRNALTGSFGNTVSAGGVTEMEYPNPVNITGSLARKITTAQMGSMFPTTPPRPVLGFNMNDSIGITALLAGYLT
jgi:hypothetical protein